MAKILQLTPTMNPAAGGVTEAVLQYTKGLLARGHVVDVATLDSPDESFLSSLSFSCFPLGRGGAGFGHSAPYKAWLEANVGRYDYAVVNGLWQYHGLAAWQVLRNRGTPYFVFPHGMLDPWFKRTYPAKHFKKLIYWLLAERWLLRGAKKVLFTCDQEMLEARNSFPLYAVSEQVVLFGTSPPPTDSEQLRRAFLDAFPELNGKRVILFLGRLHEKKGCDLLLEGFAQVCSQDDSLRLVMAGPDHDGLGELLRQRASALGVLDKTVWPGMLKGDLKWGAFYASEVFALISHQENFGIAVAEALGCGVPVIISDKVNIFREIKAAGAGIVVGDNEEGARQGLQQWLQSDEATRRQYAQDAKACFTANFTTDAMITSFEALIQ